MGFRGSGRSGQFLLAAAAAAVLAGCISDSRTAEALPPRPAPLTTPPPATQDTPPPPAATPPAARPPVVTEAQVQLERRIQNLGRAFPGKAGIAVRDLQTGWTTGYNANVHFPQQSVSKFWVALAALEKVDRRELDLDRPVTLRRDDLTLFHQPIAALVLKKGSHTTTLDDLLVRAMTQSDNTANDFILRRAGGPSAVRNFLERHGIDGVRFGPGERLLQSQTAGLSWKQDYSIGGAFYTARANLPTAVRRAAFDRYVADPVDGATPLGIVDGLTKLKQGALLSPDSTQRLLSIMSRTRTGAQRLKGGLAPGWTVAHKTGTGQDLNGTVAGYNDIGILTAPDGRSYAIAVLIGRTSVGIPQRQRLMNDAVRAVIDYQQNLRGD